jgi:phage terminase small subunit
VANGRGLTAKQEKFIASYIRCLNASKAARDAGYAESSAHVRGHELVRNSNIAAIIKEELAKQSMTSEEVVARLAAQARGDIIDLLDPGTLTLDWEKAQAAGVSHLIKKLKQTIITNDDQQTEIFEIELYDAQKALVHLGKTMAMFVDRKEVTGKDGGPVVVFKTGMDVDDL